MVESPSSVDMFGSIPLFRGLEKDELMAIAKLSKEITFREGEAIVKTGEAGLGFYIIVDGQAVVKRKNKTVATLQRGSFFGEMALLDDQPRSADVVATEPTKCLVLLRWNFWSLVSKNKNVVRGLFKEMARRLRATNEAMGE
ncbi:MAG TPA: cyclic nucleotide-binding domain-containing protein [Nitrososphaerales archaeon]|nr:cyclic nucleotide-binding domain-containing protein [Nitrososphaerales archaeon]